MRVWMDNADRPLASADYDDNGSKEGHGKYALDADEIENWEWELRIEKRKEGREWSWGSHYQRIIESRIESVFKKINSITYSVVVHNMIILC